MATVADAPFVRTLWTDCHLRQREATDELKARGRQLNAAGLNAMAFHDHKKLDVEHRRLLSDIRARSGERESVDEIRARALELMEEIHRVDDANAWKVVS